MLYDALIVGAGPAGCAAAYDLATAGRRVLLLDKRSFPRGKACACGLTRKTLKALRYSVEPVIERECRDVVLQEAGPAFLTGQRTADKTREIRVRLRNPFCAMAVRESFDAFCLAQTLAHGRHRPKLRKIEAITALREFPTHVELDITLPGGLTETLTAPVLIGADGSNGQTRRLAAGLAQAQSAVAEKPLDSPGPPAAPRQATAAHLPAEPLWYARGFALEATVPYTALPATLPAGDAASDLVFDFAPVAGGYGWLFPKGDHVNIGVGGFVPLPTHPEAAGDPTMTYDAITRALLNTYIRTKLGVDLAALASLPGVHVSGQHLGLGGHSYVPQGRILLTGDAAGLVDPLTGEGIHSALVSGQAAAAAILEAVRPTQTPSAQPECSPTQALSFRPEARSAVVEGRLHSPAEPFQEAATLAAAYARHLAPLRKTLTFSHRAARSFYREPARGFRVMRTPLLRSLVLKTYADGLPTTKLLASLARRVA